MVLVILGLKQSPAIQELNVYLQLVILIAAGAVTYVLVIALIARSLTQKILELVSLVLPRWNLKKIT